VAPLNPKVIEELRALERGGAPVRLGELIDLFLQDAERQLAAMRVALAARDAAPIDRASQTLKRGSGNLGAMGLAQSCTELRSAARAGDWARASELVAALESEFAEVKKALLG
jgi:HPt (histidine-containing phosphotransfer) domain-containing protein